MRIPPADSVSNRCQLSASAGFTEPPPLRTPALRAAEQWLPVSTRPDGGGGGGGGEIWRVHTLLLHSAVSAAERTAAATAEARGLQRNQTVMRVLWCSSDASIRNALQRRLAQSFADTLQTEIAAAGASASASAGAGAGAGGGLQASVELLLFDPPGRGLTGGTYIHTNIHHIAASHPHCEFLKHIPCSAKTYRNARPRLTPSPTPKQVSPARARRCFPRSPPPSTSPRPKSRSQRRRNRQWQEALPAAA